MNPTHGPMTSRVHGSQQQAPPSPAASAASERTAAGPETVPMCCNKCHKPFSTTAFVCSCDCVFCEECTFDHFKTNPHCPKCNRLLSDNDFTELIVAEPSGKPATSKRAVMQQLFTKQTANIRVLTFQDLCARTLRQQDDTRAGEKFCMKQAMVLLSEQDQKCHELDLALSQLQNSLTTVEQEKNSQKMAYEKEIERLKQQVVASHKKGGEKDRVLYQFRQLHGGAL